MSTETAETKQTTPQRVVVITGANRGLGLEFTRQLLEDPNHPAIGAFPHDTIVVATARDPAAATKLKALKEKYPERLDIQPLEVTDSAQIQGLVQHVTDTYNRIDLLLNNAGIIEDVPNPRPSQVPKNEQLKVFAVNAVAPIELTTAFLPLLRSTLQANDTVRVAFISTGMASSTFTIEPLVPTYRASKAALNLYVRTYAAEVPELAFVLISPGWVQTDMGSHGGGKPPLDPPTSIKGCLQVIQNMEKSKPVDNMISYDGTLIEW